MNDVSTMYMSRISLLFHDITPSKLLLYFHVSALMVVCETLLYDIKTVQSIDEMNVGCLECLHV